MATRIQWEDLDAALTDAISAHTGPILAGRSVTAGKNSPLAVVLHTRDGTVFVKGLPSDHRMVITQAREAATSPLVRGISPPLLWTFDEAGWNVLGYEYVDGRSADYRPGSSDIDLIVGIMRTLSTIQISFGPGPLKPIQTRLRTYVDDPIDAAAFAGQTLTHTDWMPDNIIISRGRAWLIDWAWATPAQSWTDPASWVIKLIAHGHTIAAAEAIATRLPTYAAADPAISPRSPTRTSTCGTKSNATIRSRGRSPWPQPPAPGHAIVKTSSQPISSQPTLARCHSISRRSSSRAALWSPVSIHCGVAS